MMTCRIAPAPIAKQTRDPQGADCLRADDRPHHRRKAGKCRKASEMNELRPFVRKRSGDADAFGDIVNGEADDEKCRKRGGAGGERRADRQALAEIVKADAERDETGKPRPSGADPAGVRAPASTMAVSAKTTQNNAGPFMRSMVSPASSSPSPIVSISRKARRPMVSASRKFIAAGEIVRMAGQVRSPVATGTTAKQNPDQR